MTDEEFNRMVAAVDAARISLGQCPSACNEAHTYAPGQCAAALRTDEIGVGWQEMPLPEPVHVEAGETIAAAWTVPNAQYWDGKIRRVDEMTDDHVDALHREIRMLRARSTNDVWQRQATEIANMQRHIGIQDGVIARIRALADGLDRECAFYAASRIREALDGTTPTEPQP